MDNLKLSKNEFHRRILIKVFCIFIKILKKLSFIEFLTTIWTPIIISCNMCFQTQYAIKMITKSFYICDFIAYYAVFNIFFIISVTNKEFIGDFIMDHIVVFIESRVITAFAHFDEKINNRIIIFSTSVYK